MFCHCMFYHFSWKRKVGSLPDSILPSVHQMLELLPEAIREMSGSVYLHPFFWNTETASGLRSISDVTLTDSVPDILTVLAREVAFSCADVLESVDGKYHLMLSNIAFVVHALSVFYHVDVSAAAFRTSGDFLRHARRLVVDIVDSAISKSKLDSIQPLTLTYPFWKGKSFYLYTLGT